MRFFHLASLIGGALLVSIVACTNTDDPAANPELETVDGGDAGTVNSDASSAPSDASVEAELDDASACEAALESPDASRACYSGPSNTLEHGRCAEGESVCTSAGTIVCLGEVLPTTETCNGIDDDCDGLIDEDFDLTSSPEHCGACNLTCGAGCACTAGIRVETECADGQDNDGDGHVDCDDPSCIGQSCGAGCVCTNSSGQTESACGDGNDNDGDGAEDCADSDCAGQSCGIGCTCSAGAARENNCADGVDNDGNNGADCADPDCANQSCGTGCMCGAGLRRETICNDGVDNDGNNGADCADQADCPQGVACRRANGTPGICQANRTCG